MENTVQNTGTGEMPTPVDYKVLYEQLKADYDTLHQNSKKLFLQRYQQGFTFSLVGEENPNSIYEINFGCLDLEKCTLTDSDMNPFFHLYMDIQGLLNEGLKMEKVSDNFEMCLKQVPHIADVLLAFAKATSRLA